MELFTNIPCSRDVCEPMTTSRLAFTPWLEQLAQRAEFDENDVVIATQDEVRTALLLAGSTLSVVDSDVAARVQQHNPECFRLVRNDDFSRSAMMAYLPLNGKGTAAIVDGGFDALSPPLDWICRADETPTSIYLWLVYTPGKMVAGLRLLKALERIGGACPIFTRPAHDVSARILERAGFLSVCDIFPAASPTLVVALPESAAPSAQTRTLTVRVARTLDDIMKVFSIRTATYMTEQMASYGEEFDGNDFCATHLIGEIDGEPAGCVRIRYFGDFAKLERLAIRPEYRTSRLMFKIVRASFEHCRKKGFRRLYAHAREDLVPAWRRFGAKLLEGRPAFQFSDISFREMYVDLEIGDDAIKFGTDPMVTVRPEGEWNRMGPLDIAQFRSTQTRRNGIEERVRRLKFH